MKRSRSKSLADKIKYAQLNFIVDNTVNGCIENLKIHEALNLNSTERFEFLMNNDELVREYVNALIAEMRAMIFDDGAKRAMELFYKDLN